MSAVIGLNPGALWQLLRQAMPPQRPAGPRPPRRPDRRGGRGHVYLIGCGPGDPELLTLKAARIIGQADVVFYDRLIESAVLAMAPRRARRVFVGKRCGRHSTTQVDIQRQMIDQARRGRRIVRLKGGDPFIFGRGGEELAACRAAGVDCTVVPGITAALGCAAAAQLPLTYRGIARSITLLTGHTADGTSGAAPLVPLLRAGQTVAVYMARRQLPRLASALRADGVANTLPVALILDGTTARQQVLMGTLDRPPASPDCDSDAAGLVLMGPALTAASAVPAGLVQPA